MLCQKYANHPKQQRGKCLILKVMHVQAPASPQQRRKITLIVFFTSLNKTACVQFGYKTRSTLLKVADVEEFSNRVHRCTRSDPNYYSFQLHFWTHSDLYLCFIHNQPFGEICLFSFCEPES